MGTFRNNGSSENFAITDQVLLMFNEHDSRIALNWEFYTPKADPKDEITPPAAASRS